MTDQPEQPEQLDDPLIMMRAQLDQVMMLAPDAAKLARAWFDAFKAEGFADNQACYLTAVELMNNPGMPPS